MSHTRIATGNGRLRHRFWGTYSAAMAIQFASTSDAQAALAHLGCGWRTSPMTTRALIWQGEQQALDACVEVLASFGADRKAIASLAHSVDYGDPFTVQIPVGGQ